MRIRSVARLMVIFKESLHSIIVFIVTQLPILHAYSCLKAVYYRTSRYKMVH